VAEIVLLLGAEGEAFAIHAHYEEYRPGRGELFSEDLDENLGLLTRFPHLGPEFSGPFRRLRLSRHPYAIFYEVAGNRIIVHAIVSDRELDHWIRRRLNA
jgi:plasmid stabilization system protein ParE